MLLHAAVESGRLVLGLVLRIDQVGNAGAQILPGTRGAGLRDHGIALNGPRDVQRTLHLQDLALVVQRVQLGRIEVASVLLVADERVVLPAVPKAKDDVDELLRPAIALGMLDMRVETEVESLLLAP